MSKYYNIPYLQKNQGLWSLNSNLTFFGLKHYGQSSEASLKKVKVSMRVLVHPSCEIS
jgi:hypothetical protein